jgi:hypothetical protein
VMEGPLSSARANVRHLADGKILIWTNLTLSRPFGTCALIQSSVLIKTLKRCYSARRISTGLIRRARRIDGIVANTATARITDTGMANIPASEGLT